MKRDIILLTIDCWRHDALDRMPQLREHTAEFTQTDVICASAATNGAFPAILNGSYYPDVYDDRGEVIQEATPLPKLLSELGYSTAGFIGSNPYVHKWERFFDEYWNINRRAKSQIKRKFDRFKKLTFLTKEVNASEVGRRARKWYRNTDGPRFLWMHVMEPHSPFNPGLSEGFEQGILSSYRSVVEYTRDDQNTTESMSESTQKTIEDLYWRCINRLDEQIPELLDFVDEDATVIVTGDHGEEHHHGTYKHARLYDECVRVPGLFRWTLPTSIDLSPYVRQIDLAPTILEGLGVDVPESWEGRPISEHAEARKVYILNHSPPLGEIYVGIRNAEYKYIRTYDEGSRNVRSHELYHLRDDPDEIHDLYGQTEIETELEGSVDRFIREHNILNQVVQEKTNVSDAVDDRLRELGYK